MDRNRYCLYCNNGAVNRKLSKERSDISVCFLLLSKQSEEGEESLTTPVQVFAPESADAAAPVNQKDDRKTPARVRRGPLLFVCLSVHPSALFAFFLLGSGGGEEESGLPSAVNHK